MIQQYEHESGQDGDSESNESAHAIDYAICENNDPGDSRYDTGT